MLRQLCEEEWNDRKPTVAGEVFRFKGQVGCAWGGIRCKGTPGLRLVEAGATKGDAERARRKKPVDEARRGAGESRARPAALVIANDMAKAQAYRLRIST